MKYFIAIILACAIALGLHPDPAHQPEGGDMLDAFLAGPVAHADQPCIRLSSYTPRYRPQTGYTPNFKPGDWQKCTRLP